MPKSRPTYRSQQSTTIPRHHQRRPPITQARPFQRHQPANVRSRQQINDRYIQRTHLLIKSNLSRRHINNNSRKNRPLSHIRVTQINGVVHTRSISPHQPPPNPPIGTIHMQGPYRHHVGNHSLVKNGHQGRITPNTPHNHHQHHAHRRRSRRHNNPRPPPRQPYNFKASNRYRKVPLHDTKPRYHPQPIKAEPSKTTTYERQQREGTKTPRDDTTFPSYTKH